MSKRTILIDIVLLGAVSLVLYTLNIRICPFYNLFEIPCPGCGLTRAIICLLNFDVYKSLQFNILGIIVVLIVFIYTIFVILNKDNFINEFIQRNKIILIILSIILLIVVEFININNPILY